MNRKLSYAEAIERDSWRRPDLEARKRTVRRVLWLLACWCLGVAFVLLLCLDGWN